MIVLKKSLGVEIALTDEPDAIMKYEDMGYPVVSVLSENRIPENMPFTRFAVDKDFFDDSLQNQEMFLEKVACRHMGVPLIVSRGERISLRELTEEDALDVCRIFEESDGEIEPFYESPDEARVYLREYSDNVYDLQGYGIWGIVLNHDIPDATEENASEKNIALTKIVGLAGISDKGDGPELIYALLKSVRGNGIGQEAAELAISYTSSICSPSRLFVKVEKNNIKSLELANKLNKKYGIRVEIFEKNKRGY